MTRTLLAPLYATTFALFLLVIPGCGVVSFLSDNETDIPIVDLRFRSHPIGWLDNETVVVIGDARDLNDQPEQAKRPDLRVMTVNYRTGARTIFGKFTSEVCFWEGYVSYVYVDESNELWAAYGELGKETVVKTSPGELTFHRGGSCRPMRELAPLPEWSRSIATQVLWPRVGVISCNVRSYSYANRQVPASFHKLTDPVGIELPFSCFDVRYGFKYYTFKGAYFAQQRDLVSPWPVGRDRKAYWLYADGKVETVLVPYSAVIRDTMIPTARGIVTLTEPASGDSNLGVYLITSAGPKRILRGYAGGSVSPDGCRLAVSHDPEFIRRIEHRRVSSTPSLKILELCSKDEPTR